MKNIIAALHEIIENEEFVDNDYLLSEYKKEESKEFNNFEESNIYMMFDSFYSSLGYDYGFYSDLLLNNIYGTSDLIDVYIEDLKQPL